MKAIYKAVKTGRIPRSAAVIVSLLTGCLMVLSGSVQAAEMLIFDWNGVAYKDAPDTHIPKENPARPEANGDWTQGADYKNGTIHIRVEIRSQPVPQRIYPQWIMWQSDREGTDPHHIEKGRILRGGIYGTPGNVKTWAYPVQGSWPMDFTRPRTMYGYGIKAAFGSSYRLVSSMKGYEWANQNPDHWYPLDHRCTAVAVSNGATFSGWQNYIFNTTTASPVITVNQDNGGPATVSITCADAGAEIYYTLDKSDPTRKSCKYTGPFTMVASRTVTARAFASRKERSAVVTSERIRVSMAAYDLTVMEAEDMTLDGYIIQDRQIAVDPAVTAPHTGMATGIFTGADGDYLMAVLVVPENDGQGTVTINHNGSALFTRTIPSDYAYGSGTYRDYLPVVPVSLKTGDGISIKGTSDPFIKDFPDHAAAFAKVDRIVFYRKSETGIGSGATGRPVPYRTLTVAPGMEPELSYAGETLSITIFTITGEPVHWEECGAGMYIYRAETGNVSLAGSILKMD